MSKQGFIITFKELLFNIPRLKICLSCGTINHINNKQCIHCNPIIDDKYKYYSKFDYNIASIEEYIQYAIDEDRESYKNPNILYDPEYFLNRQIEI